MKSNISPGHRLLPVELSPAIKDAIIASGHFQPLSLWAAIIAAHDLVSGQAPIQSGANCVQCDGKGSFYGQQCDICNGSGRTLGYAAQQQASTDTVHAWFHRLSDFGPWIECRADEPGCVRFTSTAQEQAAIVPAGWKLVPVKISDAMIESALAAHYGQCRLKASGGPGGIDLTVNDTNYSGAQAMRRMWKGALAAAPPPPVAQAHALTNAEIEAYEAEHSDRFGNLDVPAFARAIAAHLTRKGAL